MSLLVYNAYKRVLKERARVRVGSNIYQVCFSVSSSLDSNYVQLPIYIRWLPTQLFISWGLVGGFIYSPPPLLGCSSPMILNFASRITNEGPLRTYSVVHPEYTIRKHVSKPLPSPNLDDRLPRCPHYPGKNQESGGALVSSMSDGMPV